MDVQTSPRCMRLALEFSEDTSRRLDRINEQMATMTAAKKIMPKTQKDIASFETDIQSVPSVGICLTYGGYSSAKFMKNLYYKTLIC